MSIGILGDGISGLHLALRLQQLGIPAALYGAAPPEAVRRGRAMNFVARSGRTQARERDLGVDFWHAPDTRAVARTVRVHASRPLAFRADPQPPYSMVDFRIYLPALLEEYLRRGGRHTVRELTVRTAVEAARDHDLVVVCGGRAAGGLFARDDARSPFRAPRRLLCGGLYRGIGEAVPHGIELHILPGTGEILRMPFHSADGRVDVLGLGAIPGGPLEAVCRADHAADPAAFHRGLLAALRRHVPELRERVDTRSFALTRPADLLRGGVTPVVRRAWRALPEGGFAFALGDTLSVNDPITAQGANLGSHCALVLADAIAAAGPPYDEAFCRAVAARLLPQVESVAGWTNSFLHPPAPHLLRLFAAADADPAVAAAFAANFDDPVAMWQSIASPGRTDSFLAAFGHGPRQAPVSAPASEPAPEPAPAPLTP